MTTLARAVFVGALLFAHGLSAQDAQPLPERQAFFAAVRENMARAQREQGDFAYKERRTELRTNPFGRIGTGPTRVYEVTPLPEGGFARRLLERDGKAVSNSEPERFGRRNRGTRRSGRSALDDALASLDMRIDRREREGERSIVVLAFKPRPDATPETREGRMARYFTGEIRVDERLHEVVRIDATAIDDIAYGLGLIARLNEGSHVSVVRQQVEPNLWMPVSVKFQGQGRAMLFRRLNLDFSIEWSDYRRISTDSQR